MSKQPPRPYFGTAWRNSECITSSFMDVESVISALVRHHKHTGGYVVNKNRDVFAKVEVARVWDEGESTECTGSDYEDYATVEYLTNL